VVSVATVVRESAGNLLCFGERQRGGCGEKNGRIDDIVARRVDLTARDVMYKPLELGRELPQTSSARRGDKFTACS
jgi:hypothetical protein